MIDFLKRNRDNISPEVYRRLLFFYEWNNLSFYEKQVARKAVVEDYRELLGTTKVLDTSTVERAIELHERDIDLYNYLSNATNMKESAFFELYNAFRCFAIRFLIYEEVNVYMKDLLNRDANNLLRSDGRERIIEYLDSTFLEYGKRQFFRAKKSGFEILKKDMVCFSISLDAVEKSLKELDGIYKYEIVERDASIVINFYRSRRRLPLLHLIKVERGEKNPFVHLINIGSFINTYPA